MIPRFQGLVTVNFIQKDYSLQNRTFDDCFFRNISTLNYSICDRNEDLHNITNMILRQSSDCFVQYNENEIFKRLISNYLKLFVNKNFFVSLFSLVFSQTIEIMYFRKKKTTRLSVENKTLLSLLMNVTLLGQISHSNTSRPTVKVTSCEILLKVVSHWGRSLCICQKQQLCFELVLKTNYLVVSESFFLYNCQPSDHYFQLKNVKIYQGFFCRYFYK